MGPAALTMKREIYRSFYIYRYISFLFFLKETGPQMVVNFSVGHKPAAAPYTERFKDHISGKTYDVASSLVNDERKCRSFYPQSCRSVPVAVQFSSGSNIESVLSQILVTLIFVPTFRRFFSSVA
jgi:hypothetical protein